MITGVMPDASCVIQSDNCLCRIFQSNSTREIILGDVCKLNYVMCSGVVERKVQCDMKDTKRNPEGVWSSSMWKIKRFFVQMLLLAVSGDYISNRQEVISLGVFN